MRSFVASIILIAVLLSLGIINNFYIKDSLDQIASEIEALPSFKSEDEFETRPDVEDTLSKLKVLWSESSKLISLTVNQKYISDITIKLAELNEAYAAKEVFDFLSLKESALHSIAVMRAAQCTSFASIV